MQDWINKNLQEVEDYLNKLVDAEEVDAQQLLDNPQRAPIENGFQVNHKWYCTLKKIATTCAEYRLYASQLAHIRKALEK